MIHGTSSSDTRPGTDLNEVRKVLREMRTVFAEHEDTHELISGWETILSHAFDVSMPATFGRISLVTINYQTAWQALHAKPVPGTVQSIYIPDFEPGKVMVTLDLRDAEK